MTALLERAALAQQQRTKRPTWLWGIAGCAALVVFAGIVLASLTFLQWNIAPTPTKLSEANRTTTQPATTPTPRLPVLSGTPVPQPLAPISPANAEQITQLARWEKGKINQVVWSPDNQQIAIGSSIGIYLYDAQSLQQTLFIETDVPIGKMVFLLGWKLLAAKSSDKIISLWDVTNSREVRKLSDYTNTLGPIASSPNGRILAAGVGGSIKLWDVDSGREVQTLGGG